MGSFHGLPGSWKCLGFRVEGLGFRVEGLGFRVEGLGLRVEGLGFRVEGFASCWDSEEGGFGFNPAAQLLKS